MNRLWLLLLLPLLPAALSAQKNAKPNYKLLWEIRHPNSSKVSYLFGSMHVRNPEAFEFCDSMFVYMQNCEVFANEIHFDSLIYKTIENTIHKNGEDAQEKAPDWPAPPPPPCRKNKGNITSGEITFLDAYLMGIAKKMGKTIIGLEALTSQDFLLEEAENTVFHPDAGPKSLENLMEAVMLNQMLGVYRSGDIDRLYTFVTQDAREGLQLDSRNLVMHQSIIRHIQADKSIFAVVGAAHLPGETGLLELLKADGYQLRRVNGLFSGKKAPILPDQLTWTPVHNLSKTVQAGIPGWVLPIKNGIFTNGWISMELGNGLAYSFFPYNNSEVAKKGKDLLTTLEEHFFKRKNAQYTVLSNSKKNGIQTIEYLFEYPGEILGQGRLKFIISPQYTGVAQILAYEKEALSQASALQFLESLQVVEKSSQWETVTSAEGAFSIQMPAAPAFSEMDAPIEDGSGKSQQLHLYQAADPEDGSVYLARYLDQPHGYLFVDDSSAVYRQMESFLQSFELREEALEKYEVNGFQALKLFHELENENIAIRSISRGNRVYLLIAINGNASKRQQFFDSFRFLPNLEPELFPADIAKGLLTVPLPQGFVTEASEQGQAYFVNTSQTWGGNDPNSGVNYMVEKWDLSRYFHIPKQDSLFNWAVKTQAEGNGKIIHQSDTTLFGKYPARQFTFAFDHTRKYSQGWIMWTGNTLWTAYLHYPLDWPSGSRISSFLNGIGLQQNNLPRPDLNILQPKANVLLEDLQNIRDTLIRDQALNALSTYNFVEAEYPLVFSAIGKSYADDAQYDGIKCRLIQELANFNTNAILPLLENTLLTGSPAVKAAALETLSKSPVEGATKVYFKFLDAAAQSGDQDWLLEASLKWYPTLGFQDSIQKFIAHFEHFKELADSGVLLPDFFLMFSKCIDELPVDELQPLIKDQDFMVNAAQTLVKQLQSQAEEGNTSWAYATLVQVFKGLPPHPIQLELSREILINGEDAYTRQQALTYLLDHETYTPDMEDLTGLLQDSLYAIETIDLLKAHDLLNLVPGRLLTKENLGKLMIQNYLFEYDESPDSCRFIRTETTAYKGKIAEVMLFEFYTHGEGPFLSIAGPFYEEEGNLNWKREYCNISYENYENESDRKAIYQAMMKEVLEE